MTGWRRLVGVEHITPAELCWCRPVITIYPAGTWPRMTERHRASLLQRAALAVFGYGRPRRG